MQNKFWLLLIFASSLGAQQADPLADLMFPPELVMARQNAISLSDAQKTYLRAEVLKAQTRFTELQWQLQDAMEGLTGLLKQPKADETQVSAQLDKVLAKSRCSSASRTTSPRTSSTACSPCGEKPSSSPEVYPSPDSNGGDPWRSLCDFL